MGEIARASRTGPRLRAVSFARCLVKVLDAMAERREFIVAVKGVLLKVARIGEGQDTGPRSRLVRVFGAIGLREFGYCRTFSAIGFYGGKLLTSELRARFL